MSVSVRALGARVLAVGSALVLAGRGEAQDTTRTMSTGAASYLAHAIAVVRDNALWSDSVDWNALRRAAFDSAVGARVPVDTYRAIRFVLRSLGDRHSFLQLPVERLNEERRRLAARGLLDTTRASVPAGRPVPFVDRRIPEGFLHRDGGRRIARVVVPRTGAMSVEDFATRIHDIVRELYQARPCGWIVDLRGNTGGNMWPMMAGIGPLLDATDNAGGFFGRRGLYGRWYYRAGEAGMTGLGEAESFVGARIRGEPVAFGSQPPVAVLIDGFTGSSGEAVAIAFKGRTETRFFGQPSAGLSTANSGFRLADSANLVITVGVDADRLGDLYPTVVLPDDIVAYDSAGEDEQVRRAISWLGSRPACRA